MSRRSKRKLRFSETTPDAPGAPGARPRKHVPTQDAKPPGFPRKYLPLIAVGLLILSAIPYVNSLQNGFVWDDHAQVVMNPAVSPDHQFRSVFAGGWGFQPERGSHIANDYRPLAFATYRVTRYFFGFDAAAFHGVNLATNSACVLLVFALLLQLTERVGIAFAGAALFAVHPAHTEAVDWISDLKDLGCTAFVVLAFLLFVMAWKRQGRADEGRNRFLALMAGSCAAFAAALLWKEEALVYPLLVAGYVMYFESGEAFSQRIVTAGKASAAYWTIFAADLFVRWRALGFVAANQHDWQLSKTQTVLSGLDLLGKYWLKLLVPVRLNAYHVFSPVPSLSSPQAIAATVFALALAAAMVFGARRNALIAFSVLWVCVTIAPVLDPYLIGRNVFAERYLYLPSVGFCLLAALAGWWLIERLSAEPRARINAAAAALAVVVFLCIVQDLGRNTAWRDDATLFTTTLENSPNSSFVEMMVGSAQANDEAGQIAAESHYQRAVWLAEHDAPPDVLDLDIAEGALASIYSNRGDFGAALKALDEIRSVDPQDPEVDGHEGLILAQAGRWPEAEQALKKAVLIEPNDANVLNALGLVALNYRHNLGQAGDLFMRALAAHSEADDFNASLHSNLGSVYGEQERYADAINQFQIALQIVPDEPEYLTNLGMALAATGRRDEAIAALRRAAQVAPDYEPARAALEEVARPSGRKGE